MRLFAIFLWLGIAISPAAAQTVTFRSGEHATFSRLVLDIPAGRSWTFGRHENGYVLDLGSGIDFDLTSAFDRIPRDRLAALDAVPGTGRLVLQIGCVCHATAFLFQPDKLVIDVAEGAPLPGSPFETVAVTGLPEPDSQARLPVGLPLFLPDPAATDLLFDFSPNAAVGARTALPPQSLDRLAEDMSRAVAAGLLEAPEMFPRAAAADTEDADPAVPVVRAGIDDLPFSGLRPGVSFTTADMEQTIPGPRELSKSGHACRADAEVDLAAWAPSGDFARDLGALRARIVDGAGTIDDAAVIALARAYLHYGFGAEARLALAIGDTDSTEARFLGLLAAMIDQKPVESGELANQAGCLGAIALWSAVAEETLSDRTPAERTAVETALRVLPPGPRQSLAPRVSAMFLAEGQVATATDILALAPRHMALSEEVVLLRTDIAEATADAAAARTALVAAIEGGSRTGAATMVRLVDATLAAGQTVEPWMVETIAALRFEQRTGPLAGPLALAEIRALTSINDFAAAAERIADPEVPLVPEERRSLADTLIEALAERADDVTFLAFAFADRPLPMTGSGWNTVARRLIDLGFPEAALGLIDSPAEAGAMRNRRILRATALRALGQDEEAALVLAGLAEESDAPRDPLSAWRSGDWETLIQGDDPLLADAAEAVLTNDPRETTDATLADRAALIASAADARTLADALLLRFPAPDPAAVAEGGMP